MLSSLSKSYSIHIAFSSGSLRGAILVQVEFPAGEMLVERAEGDQGPPTCHRTWRHSEGLLGTRTPCCEAWTFFFHLLFGSALPFLVLSEVLNFLPAFFSVKNTGHFSLKYPPRPVTTGWSPDSSLYFLL